MAHTRSYRYLVVDVFTRVPLEGNPLAVFPDSRGIGDAAMQRIARELNLSETVFVEDAALAGCAKRFRIFTPARELVFAGHPTLGASYVLIQEGVVARGAQGFSVEEKIGPVAIRVEPGDPPMIWLETPPIAYETAFDPAACANVLQLPADDLLHIQPQILNAGNPTLLVAVTNKEAVDRAAIDTNLFSTFKTGYPAPFCIFVFTPTDEGAYSRLFAPDYGIVEDPATGSSTGPLGAFMRRHNLLVNPGRGRFVSEQGVKMGRRSLLYFEIPAHEPERISVGGYVTPLVEAVMTLPV
jgi:trans-2,3-dihydro-3-hydroxyanthranilate isomerase